MRLVLVTLRQPHRKQFIQPLERFRLLERGFAQERVDHAIETLDFARRLRRVGFREQQSNSELGTGPRHPFGSVLLTVVEVTASGAPNF